MEGLVGTLSARVSGWEERNVGIVLIGTWMVLPQWYLASLDCLVRVILTDGRTAVALGNF